MRCWIRATFPHPDLPKPILERSYIRNESVADGNSHGTHCAGTAVGRNGIGVAPAADLIVMKVLSNAGSGGNDGIAKAVEDAAKEGADVISMSLGGGGFDANVHAAIVAANEMGAIVNVAAGNSGFNGANSIDYPGKYLETLCVGAFREDGSIANFSSGGRQLDYACPGQDILSCSNRGSGYISMSGTSMATPYGSGLLALIIGEMRREGHAQLRGADAWRKFLEKWTEDAGQDGRDDRFGLGIPRSDAIVQSLAADDVTMLAV